MAEAFKPSFTKEKIEDEIVNSTCQRVPVFFYESTSSTNALAKDAARRDAGTALFVADSQSEGRGRLGRSFVSTPGVGIYMSLLLKLSGIDTAALTAYAAVKLALVIERLSGTDVDIKWVNDIYKNGKKLAGILCESVISPDTGRPEYVIIGIGINVLSQVFPPEIRSIAGSIEDECGEALDRAHLTAELLRALLELEALGTPELLSEYKARSFLLGKNITVHSPEGDYEAIAVDIDRDFALIVSQGGELRRVFSGDVSVREIRE